MPRFPHKQRVFSPSPVLSRLIPSFSNTLSPYTNLIPDGYELIDEGAFAGTYWVDYQNSPGDRLEIELSPSGHFDTEGAELEPTQIQGLPAYIIDQLSLEGDNHGIIKVIVLNEAEGYILSVISIPHSTTAPPPISRNGIVHITESIFE